MRSATYKTLLLSRSVGPPARRTSSSHTEFSVRSSIAAAVSSSNTCASNQRPNSISASSTASTVFSPSRSASRRTAVSVLLNATGRSSCVARASATLGSSSFFAIGPWDANRSALASPGHSHRRHLRLRRRTHEAAAWAAGLLFFGVHRFLRFFFFGISCGTALRARARGRSARRRPTQGEAISLLLGRLRGRRATYRPGDTL
jgi:hypothetical protein